MIGWAWVIVGGGIVGVTSWWHGRAGGVGTTGAPFVVVALVVLVAFTAAGAWAGRRG